jgi:tripartite-type tricarboxylate transporter receptor subunit TctC
MRKIEMKRRKVLSLFAACSMGLVLASQSTLHAQPAFPSRPVRVIVPFAPGGANDVIARLVASRLSEVWGQQVIVENRTGAGGNLGAEVVARADADGYTIMLNASSLVVNSFLYPNMTFDPMKDFAPLSAELLLQPCRRL